MAQLIYLPLLLATIKLPLVLSNKNTSQQHSIGNCTSGDTGLRFYPEAKSWIDALKHCDRANSSLVHNITKTVQEDVKSLLKNKTDQEKGVWIGLDRSIFGCNVAWMWTSGTKVEDAQWKSSFPNDPVNNHCGKIIWVDKLQEYKWLDARCDEKLPFICQDKLLFCSRPNLA